MATNESRDPQDWPEWCVRQSMPGGRACVWVLAPSAAAAAVIANHLCGPMGGWRVGPDIELEGVPALRIPRAVRRRRFHSHGHRPAGPPSMARQAARS